MPFEANFEIIKRDGTTVNFEIKPEIGDKNYVHQQTTPATVWNVCHGLDKKPCWVITDSEGEEIWARVNVVDLNNLEIIFCEPMTGQVFVN